MASPWVGKLSRCVAMLLLSFVASATGNRANHRSLQETQDNSPLVEFSVPGIKLPLREALKEDLPQQTGEAPFYCPEALEVKWAVKLLDERQRGPHIPCKRLNGNNDIWHHDEAANRAARPTVEEMQKHTPDKLRIFVAIVSHCCSEKGRQKRAAVRASWLKLLKEKYPDFEAKFFVSQPAGHDGQAPSPEMINEGCEFMQEEAKAHGDIVVVRGRDYYRGLPNKMQRILNYASVLGKTYTHLLYTMDDVYIRAHKLVESLLWHRVHAQLKVANAIPEERWAETFLAEFDSWRKGYRLQYDEERAMGEWVEESAAELKKVLHKQLHELEHVPEDQRSGAVMTKLHQGAMYSWMGYYPIRTQHSTGYLSTDGVPEEMVPYDTRFIPGWAQVLSMDVVIHVLTKVDKYLTDPTSAPVWFNQMPMDDVYLAALDKDYVGSVFDSPSFLHGGETCPQDMAAKHMTSEAIEWLPRMYEKDANGEWDKAPIQCSGDPRESKRRILGLLDDATCSRAGNASGSATTHSWCFKMPTLHS